MKNRMKAKTLSLFRAIVKILAPPPKLTVSQWADQYRRLSTEASAEPGQWRTDRAPYQREIMDALNDPDVELVVIMSSSQVGKALDIDTPIPTPDGWTTMRNIQAGDVVFDEEGRPCRVTFATEVQHDRECYVVAFSDGAALVTDAEHQWLVQEDKRYGPVSYVTTTKAMLRDYKNGARNRYAVPVPSPLQIEAKALPIDPYVLGVWLGDGHSYSGQFTLHADDIEIVRRIEELGYEVVVRQDKEGTQVLNVQIMPRKASDICIRGHNQNIVGRTSFGRCAECHRQQAMKTKWKNPSYLDPIVNPQVTFHTLLTQLGVLRNKHIPQTYLRASVEQRYALLQGLMDTDGHITKHGRCEITLTSKQLIEGVSELLSSLGIKHTLTEKTALCTNSKTRASSEAWRLSFLAYNTCPVFSLARKTARLKSVAGGRPTETQRRRITGISPVASRPVKCIAVDSPSHLYLAGRAMIPTHNTEIINNVIGYFADYDPAPILLVMPTKELAESYSKDRLAPMLRDTPALKGKVRDVKSRDSNNTLLHKKFPGGHITMVGANAPSGLASRPIRILLADEVDRFPASAGVEGDPLDLAAKRTTTFWNRKKLYTSTPTVKGVSRIEAEYEDSTMEQWCLPCPACGELQPLTWGQIRFEDITMECRKCKERFGEFEWKAQQGDWVSQKEHSNKRGFHLNELASPWKRWEDIIEDFREAKSKGPENLKVWVNTSLGESWEEKGELTDHEVYLKRRERYHTDLTDGVLVLTAGVDVQDDRLEVEVVGWGVGKESWGIEYKAIMGDPGQAPVWDQLDQYLSREYSFADGRRLLISCACVDSGGHFTSEVYKYCKAREHRRIFAIKGHGGYGLPFVGKATRNNRIGAALFSLGVDTGKELVISRLKVAFEGPGYCHYPEEGSRGYDEAYFKGLTAEKQQVRYHKGRKRIEWVKVASGARNEPLDIRNYATAALEILNPPLEQLAEQQKDGNIYVQKPYQRPKQRRVISKGIQ